MSVRSEDADDERAGGLRAVGLGEVLAGTDRLELFAVDGAGHLQRASGPFLVVDGGLVVAGDPAFADPGVSVIASFRRPGQPGTVSVAVTVSVVDERMAAHFARALPGSIQACAHRAWLLLRPQGPAIERGRV